MFYQFKFQPWNAVYWQALSFGIHTGGAPHRLDDYGRNIAFERRGKTATIELRGQGVCILCVLCHKTNSNFKINCMPVPSRYILLQWFQVKCVGEIRISPNLSSISIGPTPPPPKLCTRVCALLYKQQYIMCTVNKVLLNSNLKKLYILL